MIIPYKDDNSTETIPYVTVSLIAINIGVFFWELTLGPSLSAIFRNYGAVPSIIMGNAPSHQPINAHITILTAMFLHGTVLHIAFNMLFLWIFGNNIEDKLGHFAFLAFYLLGGYLATIVHTYANPTSTNSAIGASGAVSAVLGAYMVLYPKAKVRTILFLGIIWYRIRIPALILIGIWATIQIVSAINATLLGHTGMAWFAHVGGIAFGAAAIKAWPTRKDPKKRRLPKKAPQAAKNHKTRTQKQ